MGKKKKLAEKVSKETGVSEKKLERLPITELEKLDELTPDEDPADALGPDVEITIEEVDVDALNEEAEELESKPIQKPKKEFKEKSIFLGYHPMTGEKVFS